MRRKVGSHGSPPLLTIANTTGAWFARTVTLSTGNGP